MVGQVLGWTRVPSPAIQEPRAPSRAAPTSCPRSATSPPRAASAALLEGRRPGAQPRGVAAGTARGAPGLVVLSGLLEVGCAERKLHLPGGIAASSPLPTPPRPRLRAGLLALKGTRPE